MPTSVNQIKNKKPISSPNRVWIWASSRHRYPTLDPPLVHFSRRIHPPLVGSAAGALLPSDPPSKGSTPPDPSPEGTSPPDLPPPRRCSPPNPLAAAVDLITGEGESEGDEKRKREGDGES
jgi:hypothetical protein